MKDPRAYRLPSVVKRKIDFNEFDAHEDVILDLINNMASQPDNIIYALIYMLGGSDEPAERLIIAVKRIMRS